MGKRRKDVYYLRIEFKGKDDKWSEKKYSYDTFEELRNDLRTRLQKVIEMSSLIGEVSIWEGEKMYPLGFPDYIN